MARPLWFVELLKKAFPHRHIIALLTHIPIIGSLIDKMLFESDDIVYLPTDNVATKTIPIDQSLELPKQSAIPSQIVHHFIEKANYHWIMNFCICRSANKCEDYPIDIGCLFLGEAVKGINPQLGRLVSKEEAHEHVRKAREAGLVHMIGRNKLDAMWLNVKPEHKLMSICNCCPCCCLWRVLPNMSPDISRKVARIEGVSVTVTDACTGCGACIEDICFVDAIRLEEEKAVISDDCRGCGRCVEVCPQNAITLSIEDADFVNHTVRKLEQIVDTE
ncbi:MAG: 4Fe-4S dicluster domain-containing protein [Candidatus Lokiarchaeota archaeon]|nr:4Fe-4S dicluster domain-containing protein [Candidatus Lokiarchaeota archaeon]